MKNSTRKLFSVASVISYVTAGILGFIALSLLFEDTAVIAALKDAYFGIVENASTAGFEQTKVSLVLLWAFAAYMSFSAGRLYNLIAKAPEKTIMSALNTLAFMAFFQLAYGVVIMPPLSFIAPILAIIGWAQCRKLSKKQVNLSIPAIVLNKNSQQTVTVHPQAVQVMVDKINQLKRKKQQGLYTEEQYNTKLSKILGGEFD